MGISAYSTFRILKKRTSAESGPMLPHTGTADVIDPGIRGAQRGNFNKYVAFNSDRYFRIIVHS